jgi:hypothetical protein
VSFNERRFTEQMRARYGTELEPGELRGLRLLFAEPVSPIQSAVRWALVSGFTAGVAVTLIVLTLIGRMTWQ